MMQEVNPKETTRAYAFEMWMNAPMPMVTLFKTLDVTRVLRISRRRRLKFNMLMCWCIGRAASQVKEFYMLPVGDKLIRYDSIAVNTIVLNRKGEVSSCDIPYSDSLNTFNNDYLRLTSQVADTCENHDITDSMVIGTSALAQYDIDGAVGMYSGIFNNPFKLRYFLWKPPLPSLLTKKRCNNILYAWNLSDLLKCYAVVSWSIPSQCHIHNKNPPFT